jgi:hypothetical protein
MNLSFVVGFLKAVKMRPLLVLFLILAACLSDANLVPLKDFIPKMNTMKGNSTMENVDFTEMELLHESRVEEEEVDKEQGNGIKSVIIDF